MWANILPGLMVIGGDGLRDRAIDLEDVVVGRGVAKQDRGEQRETFANS